MTSDPQSSLFWSEDDLRGEFLRVARQCGECRRCENLCPPFRALSGGPGGLGALSGRERMAEEFLRASDLCFQCGRCAVVCPYAQEVDPRRAVDFPRLLLRERIVRGRVRGAPHGRGLIFNPDLAGSIGSLAAPFSNWIGRSSIARRLLQRTTGLDHRAPMPSFRRTTFDRWIRKKERRLRKMARSGRGKVALFHSCSVNYFRPEVGRSAVSLLARHGIEVVSPDQRCCGRARLEGGQLHEAVESAKENLRLLRRYADDGFAIVSPQPECARMIRSEYPWLAPGEDAARVSAATWELCDYLLAMHRGGKLDLASASRQGSVLYHVSCHARPSGSDPAGLQLLRMVRGLKVTPLEGCCGMGRTWGFVAGRFSDALETARPLLRAIDDLGPERIVSDCLAAGMLISARSGKRVHHPIEMLCEAHGHPPGID
ncbi:MAG: hypothetical protein FJY88_06595 [Candidatus Eisenbacteria bacterium]|nr:hypothetical protein [Candidatus Eisenbacteria bacterium]